MQEMWNAADAASGLTVSNNALRLSSTGAGGSWKSARSVASKNSGKFYLEVVHAGGAAGQLMVGFATSSMSLTSPAGFNNQSWSIRPTETGNLNTYYNASATVVGTSSDQLAIGQRAMLAVDCSAGKIWFGTKGNWKNGNPAAGTGQNYTFAAGTAIYVVATLNDLTGVVDGVLPGDLLYTPPAGFELWIPQLFTFSGTVRDKHGALVARTVTALRESNQTVVGTTISDSVTGAFEIVTTQNEPHTLIFSGEPDRNALVYSGVMPA